MRGLLLLAAVVASSFPLVDGWGGGARERCACLLLLSSLLRRVRPPPLEPPPLPPSLPRPVAWVEAGTRDLLLPGLWRCRGWCAQSSSTVLPPAPPSLPTRGRPSPFRGRCLRGERRQFCISSLIYSQFASSDAFFVGGHPGHAQLSARGKNVVGLNLTTHDDMTPNS